MKNRRRFIADMLASGLVAAAVPASVQASSAAPEFVGIDQWLNAPAPLTVAGLRGRVALVDFWTYSCINCRRTVPYLNRWQAEYGAHGFQVVGIHTPEFGFERSRTNVDVATRRLGIEFPVGQDNHRLTWQAWGNRAWPAFYLLDRSGRIVLMREGEGHARELESSIRALLGVPPSSPRPGDDTDLSRVGSLEIYFGDHQSSRQDRTQEPRSGETTYVFPPTGPRLNEYQLDGRWAREGEALVLRSPRGALKLRFSAAKLHLVAASAGPTTLLVASDGAPVRTVEIGEPTLYTLLDGASYGEHTITIQTDRPGLSVFSATFG
ncbi:redoxin family protein [Enterovirga sp. CN4-39]|uniref:redoxin family protein n=1 Tax=Enterovirga sp. CN4-39 TaxID=3400910 RepID=UPI003C03CCEF